MDRSVRIIKELCSYDIEWLEFKENVFQEDVLGIFFELIFIYNIR